MGIGPLLRTWRENRRMSQLELAVDAEISARHLSFIETSRAKPSREMVLKLSERLNVPLGERNRLLIAAGFAPVFSHVPFDGPAMFRIRGVLHAILQGPVPAVVVDRRWNLMETNAAAAWLIGDIDPELLKPPANALRIALHPRGMAPRIINFGEWRAHLLERLRREAEFTHDAELVALLAEARAYPWDGREVNLAPHAHELVVPLRVRHSGRELAFLGTVATFGTPVDVTVADLMVESFFPADDLTAQTLATRA